jgi:hypothetical protein
MTAVTFQSRPISKRQARPKTGRTQVGTVDIIAASVMVLRPVVVSVGIVVAAVTWATPSHADPVGDSVSSVLNTVGIGNNGPISSVIAQIGQSVCPMLVQPGSNFASSATQMSGNGGLASPIAGFLAGQAIQSQCPAFMTAISNGTMPFGLSGASPSPAPFGLPGASPAPFGLPGASPAPFGLPGASPSPFGLQLPGTTPPAPSPFALPGL